MKTARNGKIEIMRFVYAMVILFFHIGKDLYPKDDLRTLKYYISYFYHGRSGVEFFFLLSGFFCAAIAYKHNANKEKSSIGIDTYEYVKGKIIQILPYHIFANAGLIIIFAIKSNNFAEEFLNKLPSLFFLQKTGISKAEFNGIEWYIPAMLFALSVLYPLLRKNFDMMSYVVAPVASTFTIGYFIHKYGKMPKVYQFGKFMYLCNIRALAIMLLGVFCYVMAMKLKEKRLSKWQSAGLIIIENACWIASLAFCISNINSKYEAYNIYIIAVAITICLSRNITAKVYNNKFVFYLGKLSLPLYLSQNIARHIFMIKFSGMGMVKYSILVAILAIIVGIICKEACDAFMKHIKKCKAEKAV